MVPGLPGLLAETLLLLPQPVLNPRARVNASVAPNRLAQRRRRMGASRSKAATAMPPPIGSRGVLMLPGSFIAAEAAVVETVRVAV